MHCLRDILSCPRTNRLDPLLHEEETTQSPMAAKEECERKSIENFQSATAETATNSDPEIVHQRLVERIVLIVDDVESVKKTIEENDMSEFVDIVQVFHCYFI